MNRVGGSRRTLCVLSIRYLVPDLLRRCPGFDGLSPCERVHVGRSIDRKAISCKKSKNEIVSGIENILENYLKFCVEVTLYTDVVKLTHKNQDKWLDIRDKIFHLVIQYLLPEL